MGDYEARGEPKKILSLSNTVGRISCGLKHVTVITKDFLFGSPEDIVYAFVNFSGKTTTKNLQDAFEGNLEAKRKTLLGPPGGKKMVFFIDDVNMP